MNNSLYRNDSEEDNEQNIAINYYEWRHAVI